MVGLAHSIILVSFFPVFVCKLLGLEKKGSSEATAESTVEEEAPKEAQESESGIDSELKWD